MPKSDNNKDDSSLCPKENILATCNLQKNNQVFRQ